MIYIVTIIVAAFAAVLFSLAVAESMVADCIGLFILALLVGLLVASMMGCTAVGDPPPCPHPGHTSEYSAHRDGLLFPDLSNYKN